MQSQRMRLQAWLCLGMLACTMASGVASAEDEADYLRVEICGKLRHGVLAIGGETTGTEIMARGITWELDLSADAKLGKLAEALNGKQVVVRGELERRRGTEVAERWIVHVVRLEAAPAK